MEIDDSKAVIYATFSSMFSPKYCGSKAIEFQCSLPGSFCVAVKAVDLENALAGYEQIFRRMLKRIYDKKILDSTDASTPTHIKLLIDESHSSSDFNASLEEHRRIIDSYLQSIWQETYDKVLA